MEVVLILFFIGLLSLVIYLEKVKLLIWAIVILVGAYFLSGIGLVYYISRPSFDDEDFEKAGWFAKPGERFKMAENPSPGKRHEDQPSCPTASSLEEKIPFATGRCSRTRRPAL